LDLNKEAQHELAKPLKGHPQLAREPYDWNGLQDRLAAMKASGRRYRFFLGFLLLLLEGITAFL